MLASRQGPDRRLNHVHRVAVCGGTADFLSDFRRYFATTGMTLCGNFRALKQVTPAEIAASEPDIILVISDGYREPALAELSSTLPDARIIVLTRSPDPTEYLDCLEYGVLSYLPLTDNYSSVVNAIHLASQGIAAVVNPLAALALGQRRRQGILLRHIDGIAPNGRQLDVLIRLARGLPNKIIAHDLRVSEATVKVHIKTTCQDLNLRNRTQAALWAFARDLY